MASATRKFEELVLYAAKRSEADPRCGKTKLNKILFYADFWAYRQLGKPISSHCYLKKEFGPVPQDIDRSIDDMVRRGDCIWAERSYFGRQLHKLIPLREPDLSLFSGEEIDVVNEVISDLWELNGSEVSDLSHRFVGWRAADLGEPIPYDTIFLGNPRPLSSEEMAWIEGLAGPGRRRKRMPHAPTTCSSTPS